MKLRRFLRIVGPGLLFASMAIGTSHLVLSTQAGARFGGWMVLPILLANLLKYPFFEFGVRYTQVTKTSLIEGYQKRGGLIFWSYALITLVSSFTILAALYTVTGGLLINMFPEWPIGLPETIIGLFGLLSVILIIGRYKLMENALKVVVSSLFISLIITTVLVLNKGARLPVENFVAEPLWTEGGVLFLIALIGWMPTAVEASAWVSMWNLEKYKALEQKPSLRETLTEFNFGYWMTAFLAVLFLLIGWYTLYGSGVDLSPSAVKFADQLTRLFPVHMGDWTYPLIAFAAFATMLSSCMSAHDALARVLVDMKDKIKSTSKPGGQGYAGCVLLLALINGVVVYAYQANMGQLVTMATFVSFVFAPLLGWMNLKNLQGPEFDQQHLPSSGMRALASLGIVFLTLFAIYYAGLVFDLFN
jgi:Mn2+/Fe2+ NRAMP family transporter